MEGDSDTISKGPTGDLSTCPFLYADSWIETLVYGIIFIIAFVRLILPYRQLYAITVVAISVIRFINYLFHILFIDVDTYVTWFTRLPYIIRHIFFVVPLSLLTSVHRYLLSNFYKIASVAHCNSDMDLKKWHNCAFGVEILSFFVAIVSIIVYAVIQYGLKSDGAGNFYLSGATNVGFATCYIILCVCDVKAILVIRPFKKVKALARTVIMSLTLLSVTLACYVIFMGFMLYEGIRMLVEKSYIHGCNNEYITYGSIELVLFITQVAPVIALLLLSYIQTPWKRLSKKMATKHSKNSKEVIDLDLENETVL